MDHGVFAETRVDGTQSANCVDDGSFQEQSGSKREYSRRLNKSRREGRGKRKNNLDKQKNEPGKNCDLDKIHFVLSLAKAGKHVQAREALDGIEMNDSMRCSSEFVYIQGILHYYRNDLDDAIKYFTKVELDHPDVKTWKDRAVVMKDNLMVGIKASKRYEGYKEAKKVYDDCLGLDPENFAYTVKVLWNRALLQESHSHLEEAVEDLTRCVQMDPENYTLWNRRGNVYWKMDMFEEAVINWEVAQKIKPTKETTQKLAKAMKKKSSEEKKRQEEVEREKRRGEEEAKREANYKDEKLKKEKFEKERRERKREKHEEKDQLSHYTVLGVEKTASMEEIKRAFRDKAKKFHPDMHPFATSKERNDMEEKMKELAASYSCLSDPDKREEYDRRMEAGLEDSDCDEYGSRFDFRSRFSDIFFEFLWRRHSEYWRY